MTNFKLPIVELGTVLCSEEQEQDIHAPTPRSRAQSNSQLAYPQPLLQTNVHSQGGSLPPSMQLAW